MTRPMQRVSMSKSGLLLSGCTAWAAPGAAWYDESKVDPEDKTKQTDGIFFHSLMDELSTSTPDKVVEDKTFQRNTKVWFDHAAKFMEEELIPRFEWYRTEVAFSLDHQNLKAEEVLVKNRNYPATENPWVQYGTADIVGKLKTGEIYVGDWKTGGSDGAKEQLKTLAYCAAKVFGVDTVDDSYAVISCLSVNEHGVWPNEESLSEKDLYNHAISLTNAHDKAVHGGGEPVPGVHCSSLYCPHLAYCPAISQVTLQLATDDRSDTKPDVPVEALLKLFSDKPTTDQEAGETMAMVSAAKRQINYIINGHKDYVSKGGKVICNGYEWKDRGNGYRWGKQ